jgi:hypothetical protein
MSFIVGTDFKTRVYYIILEEKKQEKYFWNLLGFKLKPEKILIFFI